MSLLPRLLSHLVALPLVWAAPAAAQAVAAPATAAPATAGPETVVRAVGAPVDPRWVFYSPDRTRYSSPWWSGRHRTMIGYGCTRAPYYSPDPRCGGSRGFHHGIDFAMPCGTPLFAGRAGRVVSNRALGPAYGVNPLLIRNRRLGVDFLLAHTERVFVRPGDRVRRGDLVARANDSAAPDGCHLHFEVRALGGGLDDARWPRPHLRLARGSR